MLIIEGRIEALTNALDALSGSMMGDGSVITPGVVGLLSAQRIQLQGYEDRLTRVERAIDRARWTLVGVTLAGSMVGGGIVAIVSPGVMP